MLFLHIFPTFSFNLLGHLPPQVDYTRSSGYVPLYPADPIVVSSGQLHPQQSPLSNSESSEPEQLQPQASHCQPQSSQLQDNVDIGTVYMLLLSL